jgi:molybdenum cofactor biosynthesis protein B
LTVSDTRTRADDRSGDFAVERIESAGHRVVAREIVPDEPARVREQVLRWLGESDVQVILVCGGTGISARDQTYEALSGLFDRRLEGFGELFRMLSYEQVASRSMLSRATAGIAAGKPLFLMPGSSKAVELALIRLILPEIPHLLAELAK